MYTRKLSLITIAITVFYSTISYAAPEEICFQTKKDYEIFKEFGDTIPSLPSETFHPYPELSLGRERIDNIRKARAHGLPQHKEIVIKYTEELLGNGKVRLDASSTITPSGKVGYRWSKNGYLFPEATLEDTLGKPGETVSINLSIEDPICEVEKREVVTIKLK